MMKYLAALLITASLVLGTIAATTAYLPSLDSISAADGLTLAAPAGVKDPNADTLEPLVNPADSESPIILTESLLQTLRDGGVERVRVKEFSLARWDYKLLFLAAAVGLVIGAVMIRADARREVAESMAGEATDQSSPEALLQQALTIVQDLRNELPGLASEDARIARIVEQLDGVSGTQLTNFADARPQLIGRLGAGGYAQVMDRFAGAERQLNRAWSAAVDHQLDESMICLDEGLNRLQQTLQRLRG